MSRLKNRRAKEAYHKFMCSSKCCHHSELNQCGNPNNQSHPTPPSFISRINHPPPEVMVDVLWQPGLPSLTMIVILYHHYHHD